MTLEWTSNERALLHGVPVDVVMSDYMAHQTGDERIVVLKPKAYFDAYAALFRPMVGKSVRMVELGIFEGGSALLLAEMFPTARIAAFDLRPESLAVLRHVQRMGYSDRIQLFYKTSQSDAHALHAGIAGFLGEGPIDIVIDDASHHYNHTRNSFEIVFPLLRPGGLYVIEDWAWAHWPTPAYDSWPGTAMSSLVLELVMTLASAPREISEIVVRPGMVVVTKAGSFTHERLCIDALMKLHPRTWQPLRME